MNHKKLLPQMTGLTLVLLFLAACAPTPSGPDYWPTEGWRTGTPIMEPALEILSSIYFG